MKDSLRDRFGDVARSESRAPRVPLPAEKCGESGFMAVTGGSHKKRL